jgi:hypothetical protein
MEMRHVYLMAFGKFLEDIVVPRRDGVVDVILRGDKEDFHEVPRICLVFRGSGEL